MSPRVATAAAGPDDPQPCHCAGGWFNAHMYAECERCRAALAHAVEAVRRVFPHARIVATPGIPQTTADTRSAAEEGIT